MGKLNFQLFLESDFKACLKSDSYLTKNEYVATKIFGFDIYDTEIDTIICSKIICSKMFSVVKAILNKRTFKYTEQDLNCYINYVLMCNTSFLKNIIDRGGSIRSAQINEYSEESSISIIDYQGKEIIIKGKDLIVFLEELIYWYKS